MSIADNPLAPTEEIYQRQMTSYRRTRSAIMDSARHCLEVQGYSATSMIDIADTAEVSRATLYNHFRDKGSVFRAFFTFELERMLADARNAGSPEKALYLLARSISGSAILATLRKTDPALFGLALSVDSDPLWGKVKDELSEFFGARASLVMTWLLGQTLAPLRPEQIGPQIAQLGIPSA